MDSGGGAEALQLLTHGDTGRRFGRPYEKRPFWGFRNAMGSVPPGDNLGMTRSQQD